jgi:hypothetical protein
MKLSILVAVLVIATAVAISYCYDHLAVRRAARRRRKKLLKQLTSQPPVAADFSTPEGAVLCLEEAFRQRNTEAAVACRDFATEARLWLQDRGHLSNEQKTASLPETTQAMEKSFRNALAKGLPADWILGKSYFLPHEPFADGIITVNKYTQVPEGSLFSQEILVAKSANGWRLVKVVPQPVDD